MKTISKLFMAVVAGVLAFSCVTDTTEDLGVNLGEGQTTTISIALDDETRTYINEKNGEEYPMYWSEGDKISVNGHTSLALTAEDINGNSATFTIPAVLEGDYCVTYPAADKGQVKFAAEQTHKNNSTFGDGVTTMYGYGDGSNLTLKSLTGILKIGITGSAKLTKAQISTIDRAPIAGAFDFDFEKGEIVKAAADAKDVITYSFGDSGLKLTDAEQYMHIAVPAGVYDELYVTLYDNEGGVMYATVKAYQNETEDKSLKAGKVRVFTTPIAYTPNDSVFVIHDYESLCTFASKIGTLDKNAVFVNDIEIPEGETWTPISNATYTKTIIGHGYAIKGLTKPLFDLTHATIEGLHLEDVAIVETEKTLVGAMAREFRGTMKNCSAEGSLEMNTNDNTAASSLYDKICVGGMVGGAYNATFENSTNKVNITINKLTDGTVSNPQAVGGFVGSVDVTSFDGIENRGNIEVNASNIYGNLLISGIVAREINANGILQLKNSKNYGKISTSSSSVSKSDIYVSGITTQIDRQVAELDANEATAEYTLFDNLENHGAITINGKCKNLYIGGIMSGQTRSPFKNNINTGKITLNNEATGNVRCSGLYGQVYFSYNAAVTPTYKLPAKDSTNSGDIEIAANAVIGGDVLIGGCCYSSAVNSSAATQYASYDKICNTGKITVSSTNVGGDVTVGGVFGTTGLAYQINDCSNSKDISITANMPNGTCRVGGLIGVQTSRNNGRNTLQYTDCTNSGDIIVRPTAVKSIQVGGITAFGKTIRAARLITHLRTKNTGNITCGGTYTNTKENFSGTIGVDGMTCDATANSVGGLMGLLYDDCTFNSCENSGTITIETESASHISVGGIIARLLHYKANATTTLTSCKNLGDIDFKPATITGYSNIGGMIGKSESVEGSNGTTTIYPWEIIKMTSCQNSGAIKVDHNVSTLGESFIGSMIGYANCYQLNLTGCSSSNNTEGVGMVISNTKAIINLGGMIGSFNHQVTDTTSTLQDCEHGATMSVSGNSSIAQRVGGMIGYGRANVNLNMSGCHSNGDLNVSGTTGNLYLGGLMGISYCKSFTLSDCHSGTDSDSTNNSLTLSQTGGTVYCGLIGLCEYTTADKQTFTISECSNATDIEFTSDSSATQVVVSHIIGRNSEAPKSGTVLNIDGCSVSGDFDFLGTCTGLFYYAGYYAYPHETTITTTISNCTKAGAVNVGGSIGGRAVIGGYVGYWRSKVNFDTVSNSGAINFHGTMTCEDSNLVIGGIGAQTNNSQTPTMKAVTNTGDITVTGNIGKNTLFVGGINGTEYSGSARVIKFENAVNSGNFYLGTEENPLTTGKEVYVGGISARVQAASTTFTAPILNTGNITITNATIGDIANSYIGGLVGLTAAKIDGAKNFCNIEAVGLSNVGMITGSARVAATPLVNNCAVGGSICTSMTGEGEAERPNTIPLSAGNYFNYIYGSADWTGVEGYDGCKYISAIDAEPAN